LVGVLLISALFVIPNVTAIMYGKGFKQTAIISMSLSIFSVIVGILVSYILDITPAGTIVLISIGLLAGTMGIKSAGLLSKN
ncbi:MAG: metal ABC transporter permease, partial [Nitrosopumilus sp.]|nr:metal ABC transporter permease [Nitrosopumilus sp.]